MAEKRGDVTITLNSLHIGKTIDDNAKYEYSQTRAESSEKSHEDIPSLFPAHTVSSAYSRSARAEQSDLGFSVC